MKHQQYTYIYSIIAISISKLIFFYRVYQPSLRHITMYIALKENALVSQYDLQW
jgi:hypothetical protein